MIDIHTDHYIGEREGKRWRGGDGVKDLKDGKGEKRRERERESEQERERQRELKQKSSFSLIMYYTKIIGL